MIIHIFDNRTSTFGFTRDKTGGNLPMQETNWKYSKTIDVTTEEPRIALDVDAMLRSIEEKGYYLGSVSTISQIVG